MLFKDAYITDDGSDLFDRANSEYKNIIWGRVATSNLNSESLTDAQMRAITSVSFGSFTSEGMVTSSLFNVVDNTVSIQCELDNKTYNGYARTFGIWGKVDGDLNGTLIVVARGGGIFPTKLNSNSFGIEKFFIDLTISLKNHHIQYLVDAVGYYAAASAVQKTNEIVNNLSLHTPKMYNSLWEAMSFAEEDDEFGYISDGDNNQKIILEEIDGDVFTAFGVEPVWIQDGLLFFWYYLARDGATCPHVVIASIDTLRNGQFVSLFNNVGLYTEGELCFPAYIDDDMILYTAQVDPPVVPPSPGEQDNPKYHIITRSQYSLSFTNVEFSTRPATIPNNATLIRLQLSRCGNVAIYGDNNGKTWYVFGIKLSYSPRSGFLISSYDKIVSYVYDENSDLPEILSFFGKVGTIYWGAGKYSEVSNMFLFVPNSQAEFQVVVDENENSISHIACPCYRNSMIFTNGSGVYSLFDYSSIVAKKLYDTSSMGDTADSQGFFGKYGGIGSLKPCKVTPYGVFPAKDIEMLMSSIPMAVCYEIEDYQSGGQTYYRLSVYPAEGDFSKCTKKDGMVFPLLQI